MENEIVEPVLSIPKQIAKIKRKNKGIFVLDGDSASSIAEMTDFSGKMADIKRFEFFPENRNSFALIVVYCK